MWIYVFPSRREMPTYSHFHLQKWIEMVFVDLQVSSVIGCCSWQYLLKGASEGEAVLAAIQAAASR